MSDDIELEPCGPSAPADAPPRRDGPRRGQWVAAGLAIVLAGAGLAVFIRDGDGTSAQRRLKAITAFLERPTPVAFSVAYRASEDGTVVGSTGMAGRLDGHGRATWTETSGVGWEPHPFVEENVLVAHGLYTRDAEDAGRISARQWVYTPREEFDDSLRRKRERPFAFFDSASDSPLVGAVLTGDFDTVVGDLVELFLGADGTLRATRRVTDLFPGAVRNQTSLNVEIRAGADGRPERLVLRHDLGRVGEDQGQKVTVTEVTFGRWGRPFTVPDVPRADVDATPRIDEEAFTASSFSPILAPARPPSGLVLTAARIDTGFDCHGASFNYESQAGRTLFLKQWFCSPDLSGQQWTNADGVEEPFVAGAFSGSIRRGPSGRAIVRLLTPSGSFIHAETDLDDATLRAAFATLAPVDFSHQPVDRHLPPA